jgi:hypothetical protein
MSRRVVALGTVVVVIAALAALVAALTSSDPGEQAGEVCQPATAMPASRDPFLWPFAVESPWNTPIGSAATYAEADASATADLVDANVPAYVNAGEYSHPVHRSSASDPMVRVRWRFGVAAPFTDGATDYRIPRDASPAAGADAHLHVLDPDGQTLHEAFEMSRETGDERTAFKYAAVDIRGSGIGDDGNEGTRAYGGSAIGGLIRTWDLEAGVIRHALALTLTNDQLRSGFVWPATSQDTGGPTYAGNVPMGSLVAIPAAVDLDRLDLSCGGRMLARALQDYGAYVVDRGGAFALYAEPTAEGTSEIDDMRGDLPALRALLRGVVNSSSGSVGGGGTPRQPPAPPL